jgi:hypothetical protein
MGREYSRNGEEEELVGKQEGRRPLIPVGARIFTFPHRPYRL